MAVMKPVKIEPAAAVGQTGWRLATVPAPSRNGKAIKMARPPTFSTVPITWSAPPRRVPITLTVVTTAMAETAAPACQTGPGTPAGGLATCAKYRAKAAASVAIEPLRTTRNSTQPNKNAGKAPYAARRNT